MLALLATAVFLSSALAQNQGFCCFPSQMSGLINVTKGGNPWFMLGSRFMVDFDHERFIHLHPTRDDVFILEIGHGNNVGWRYHRYENGSCTKEPTYSSEEVVDCLPDDRSIVKNDTDIYGWPTSTWQFPEFGKSSQTTVYQGEDCEPEEIRRWIDSPNDTMVYRFYNVFRWEVDTNILHPDTHDCRLIPHQD